MNAATQDDGRQRIAVVTGAARGIGAASAKALAAAGYLVEISDVAIEGLTETASEIAAAGGVVNAERLDVRDAERVQAYGAALERRHGVVDLLVSNAGFASVAMLEDIDEKHWHEVTDLNLTSHMRMARALLPAIAAGPGRIICMGSIAGHTYGWGGRLAYSSAKAGVTGLVRTLAMELGPRGITVNGIAPAGLHAAAEAVPLGRVGTPEDIAEAVVMLAGPGARFMTGQMLSVDGGMSVSL